MGKVIAEGGLVKYVTDGATYFVKESFCPTVLPVESAGARKWSIPEVFFSYGPAEKVVSLLGLARANVVSVKLASDMDLDPEEFRELQGLVGPDFYFSRAAYEYSRDMLPHRDPEIAMGYQVILDIIVRNWDDGERNMCWVDGIPVWFDFGASFDPRCQNVYRFILKLEESRMMGRVSTIVSYFINYSRRRSQILKRAARLFEQVPHSEIRTILDVSKVHIPGYFAEYIVRNIERLHEEIDIIRGAFLRENVENRSMYQQSPVV